MNCACKQILAIPMGNPFRLFLCINRIVPGEGNADFAEVDDLKAYITSYLGKKTEVEYEISGGTDIILSIPAEEQRCTLYGIEFSGTHDGSPWRYKARNAFRIVDSNCESSVHGLETFGTETYYLMDVMLFEPVDDTMYITTHGHASIKGDTLTLQSTAGTEVHQEGDTLVITQKTRIV